MALGYAAAAAEVRSVAVAEAAALREGPGVVFVDVRDPRELERAG